MGFFDVTQNSSSLINNKIDIGQQHVGVKVKPKGQIPSSCYFASAETTREAIKRLKAEHDANTNPHEHEPRNRNKVDKVDLDVGDKTTQKEEEDGDDDTTCESETPASSSDADVSVKSKFDIVELDLRTGVNQKMTPMDSSLLKDDETLVAALPEDMKEVANSVREATKRAWEAYKKSAWGQDELVTRGCSAENSFGRQGITIVDSLSTLLTMKLDEEYQEASKWVKEELDYETVDRSLVPTFEIVIRALGGLLSAYELSGKNGHSSADSYMSPK